MPKPPPADRIAVRMYRGLLGDCFLLTHRYGDQTYRALIDCGVLQCIGRTEDKPQTKAGTQHIASVVKKLYDDTDKGKLDLVVATHEHYDHLSGFIIENEQFAKFEIKEAWMAWTEDPKDELAEDIRAKRSKGLEALAALVDPAARPAAVSLAMNDDEAAQDRVLSISQLLQFYGEIELPTRGEMGFGASAGTPAPRVAKDPPRSCWDVFEWLRKMTRGNVEYLYPGQQVTFGVGERLTANVLGPPRTRKRLLQMDPTKGASEVYLAGRDEIGALRSTLAMHDADSNQSPPASALPFANRFRRPIDDRSDDVGRLYYEASHSDRRIDGEWLGTAEALALKIDGDVNNTSVALAIEGPAGDVLLFPADAQVGNWLSWHDQDYPHPAEKDAPTKTAAQLLSRVIFYKVGHHASHNATAKEKGLELMTNPDLVAMIPVVESVAKEQVTRSNKDGWEMPYGKLYDSLKAKTSGRILRGDGIPADEMSNWKAAGSRFDLDYDKAPDPLWVEVETGF